MSCNPFREQLPLLLYGDLPAEQAEQLKQHLANCAGCGGEYAALQRLREWLNEVPVPIAQVDVRRIYAVASDRQRRTARRWRYLAAVAACAAAVLLLVAVTRCEVRVSGQQLVLRWGNVPGPATLEADRNVAPAVVQVVQPPAAMEDQLQLLKELARALAKDVDSRDQKQRQELARLTQRLNDLQRLTNQQRLATDRDVAALYTAFFGSKVKGTNQ
jgi:anti-sigma factor RsiW